MSPAVGGPMEIFMHSSILISFSVSNVRLLRVFSRSFLLNPTVYLDWFSFQLQIKKPYAPDRLGRWLTRPSGPVRALRFPHKTPTHRPVLFFQCIRRTGLVLITDVLTFGKKFFSLKISSARFGASFVRMETDLPVTWRGRG